MREISRSRSASVLTSRMLAVGVLAVLLFGVVALFRAPLSGLLWQALAPLYAARNALSATDNAALRAQVVELQAKLADRDALYAEVLSLKERLGRDAKQQTLLAGVIARPPAVPYDTLMIDAGANEGIAAGDLVSAGGTLLIGEVRQVFPTTARVVLFSAPGETIDALLARAGESVLPLTLEGQGGGSFSAKVPSGTNASVGDTISAPGIGGGFYATVSAIEAKESDSFETLYARLPVNPSALRYIDVWRSKRS